MAKEKVRSVKVDGNPVFKIAGVDVTEFRVRHLGFKEFAGLFEGLSATAKSFDRELLRARLKTQVKVELSDGKSISLTDETISEIPIKYALLLQKLVYEVYEEDPTNQPKMSDGDGITSPIVVTLTSPIKFQGGKTITDLEFMAQTLGQIEDALVADGRLQQVMALFSIAKPLGKDLSFSVLPDSALERISMADGMFIMSQVAPRFLDPQGD